MIAVGDLGAVLRWVGLVSGPVPPIRQLVSADALLGEVVEYLKIQHDSVQARIAADLIEIQLAVPEWYPTWPVVGRLAEVAIGSGVGVDATLLTPIAVAAETGLPLATTSDEIAEVARPHVTGVLLV